jgi:flagellar export protein FliJ
MTRLDVDLDKAKNKFDQTRRQFQEAELKRVKLEALRDQDLENVKKYQLKREQKEMDAAGVMIYNLKH